MVILGLDMVVVIVLVVLMVVVLVVLLVVVHGSLSICYLLNFNLLKISEKILLFLKKTTPISHTPFRHIKPNRQ